MAAGLLQVRLEKRQLFGPGVVGSLLAVAVFIAEILEAVAGAVIAVEGIVDAGVF